MRELFKSGIDLYEEKILSEYTHKSKHCHLVKRGTRAFTLKTVVGGGEVSEAADVLKDLRRMGDSPQRSSWIA